MKFKINGKVVEIDNETITKAIEDEKEEVSIKNDDLSIRSKDEETKFIENLKKETGKASLEMAIKETRNDLELDFQGKTMENLIEALKAKHKTEFSKAPTEQLSQLESDLAQLKEKNKQLQSDYDTSTGEFDTYKKGLKRRSEIEKNLPDNMILPKEDMLSLIDNKIKTSVDENGRVVVMDDDGNVKKDDNLEPIQLSKAFEEFFTTNKQYIKAPEGGRGGGDSSTEINSKSIEAFDKRMDTKGVKRNSVDYNKELSAAQKDGSLVV